MKQNFNVKNSIRELDQIMAKAIAANKPSQDKGKIFPEVTAEQLRTIAYYALSGDILTPPESHHHRGSPDKSDQNGLSKRIIYQASSNGNMDLFVRLAKILNTESKWLDWMVSKRQYRKSKIKGKKPRPIDIPSETKRLYGIYTLWHLTRITQIHDYLEPTVIGFRFIHEFDKYKNRQDGITIQDVFADIVQGIIRKYGSWVTFIDLKDAFMNLPHKAIQTALMELQINHRERRRLIELVRIRTILPNKQTLKPGKYGIEQGHPVSPMVFNIVMSYLVKQMKKEGIRMASYGDDIVLVTNSESKAKEAYQEFKKTTNKLGFKNVRPLGTDGKLSRIYNVAVEPVPLIKTFKVGIDSIELAEGKIMELTSRLSSKPSMNEIRRKNKYKVISKRFLKTIMINRINPTQPAEGSDDPLFVTPYEEERAEGGYHEEGERPLVSLNNRNIFLHDDPMKETDNMDNPTILPDSKVTGTEDLDSSRESLSNVTVYSDVMTIVPISTNSASQTAGHELTGKTLNGRMSVLRGGSDAGVTPSKKDAGGVGHHIPASDPVLYQVTDEDWKILSEGRRLRCGDRYRGYTLDIRELAEKLPEDRFPHAIAQLARVNSNKGKVGFLVHPDDSWVWDNALFDVVQPVGRAYHKRGMILLMRRNTLKSVQRTRMKRLQKVPENVDMVILSVRRNRDNARNWSVKRIWNGVEETNSVLTTSINRSIACLEAVSLTVAEKKPLTVAIQMNGLAETCLLENKKQNQARSARPRQVVLFDTINRLKRWKWKKNGEWVIGKYAGMS